MVRPAALSSRGSTRCKKMMNPAEEFVYKVCKSSFLSLWSYASPRGKGGKELCDSLVVCEPDVIIFSVKEIGVGNSGDTNLDWERWNRRAVEESVRQIYGAERWLETASHVVKSDGSNGVALPSIPARRIHRLAIALGAKGRVPIQFGDFGKGFVHSLDERSYFILVNELDTVTDLVEYLIKKEMFFRSGRSGVFCGEEDLLGFYLNQGRIFPNNADITVIDDTVWRGFTEMSEYDAKKREDRDSYAWDSLIERFAKHALGGTLEFGSSFNETEKVLRIMAKENRFSRRLLGKGFKDFIESSKTRRARMMCSPSGIVYVFLAAPLPEQRKKRVAELMLRCLVARGLHQDATTVVGIATEQKNESGGYSLDAALLQIAIWTKDLQEEMERIQHELGYFCQPLKTVHSVMEYPSQKNHE